MQNQFLTTAIAGWLALPLLAARFPEPEKPIAQPPPPVYLGQPPAAPTNAAPAFTATPPPAPAATGYTYEQRSQAGRPPLIQPAQAQAIVEKFKAAYPKLGNPRLVIYVNRELVDERTGLRLAEVKEQHRQTATSVTAKDAPAASTNLSRVTRDRTYQQQPREAAPLADRQTIRDVERLFGRPLRAAGATLVDQGVAAQLQPGTGEQATAQVERAALVRVAEVAIEVLVSARSVTVAEVSGDRVYTVPDIQATAIQLKDSKILGQASASDILGAGQAATFVARNYSAQEITEATALALLEDMAGGQK